MQPTVLTPQLFLATNHFPINFTSQANLVPYFSIPPPSRVGKAVDSDDVIGMFGEDTCNSSGNRLISFLHEVDLVVCNGRRLVLDPEWTRVRPSLEQKSIHNLLS